MKIYKKHAKTCNTQRTCKATETHANHAKARSCIKWNESVFPKDLVFPLAEISLAVSSAFPESAISGHRNERKTPLAVARRRLPYPWS